MNRLGVAVLLLAALASPAWGAPAGETVSWQAEQCRESALFAETAYANVASLVPAPFDDDVLRARTPGGEKAILLFTLNRCSDTKVVSKRGEFSTAEATEVVAGVMLEGSEHSSTTFQFYTLASYMDWEPLATAFNAIGVPSVHVAHLRLSLEVDPLTRTGSMHVDIPAPAEHITAEVDIVAASPPPAEGPAVQFAVGPRGIVRVDHHSPVIGVTPVAIGTITTDRPDGVIARAMGSTSRQAEGLFFEKGPGHHHTATLVG